MFYPDRLFTKFFPTVVSEEKQDERTFENKTDVSKVTKADTVTKETKEGSATFTNDSDFASGFGTSFKTISVTVCIIVQFSKKLL